MSQPTSPSTFYDVVIVGSGPSGAVAAKRLAEAGMSVICLEQGEYPDYTTIHNTEPEYELAKDRYFGWYPNRRKLPSDYPINDAESSVAPLMWNGVGGSSVIWTAAWHRLRPSDFRVHTLDGVGADWPMTYDDLAPFYSRVEVDFSVSGVGGDTSYPHHEIPLPPFPLVSLERRFFDAHDRLGWHLWPGGNAIATVKHDGLRPCVRRGTCFFGCFDGAKASVDRTHWPICLKLGVKLVQRALVTRVETDTKGLATGVVYVDRETGVTHHQPGRVVIVSANGVGSPRLLLNSANSKHPNGLANSSDQVGRNLMMHPFSTVVGMFDDFFGGWEGPWGQRAYCHEFAETRPGVGFVRGAKWQLMGTGVPLDAFGSFPWGATSSWGSNFHDALRKRFGRSAVWAIIAEDLPNPDNRVTLDPILKDADGMPAPKLKYEASENSRRLLDYNQEQAQISMREAGAYETLVAPLMRESGWHLLGTVRMGTDPETSVVDGFGRSHDIPNLFVFDGSVMPTSGPVNPTGTVTALALRNAEAIVNSKRTQVSSMAND